VASNVPPARELGEWLAQQHRADQEDVGRGVAERMLPLWNILDTSSRDSLRESTGPWVDAVLPALEEGYRESHRVSVEFVEDYRHAMVPDAEPLVTVEVDEFPAERARVSVIVTGPVEVERQLPDLQASQRGLVSSTGAAVRIAADGGRDGVVEAVRLDDRALGYARKTDSKPCHFCALLASRGAVYKRDSFDQASQRFSGDGVAKTHDNCQCTMRPVYDEDDDLDAEATEFLRIYSDVTEGLAGQPAEMRKAFRRAYENRDAPEPQPVDVPVTTLEHTRDALLDEGFAEDSFQVEWYDRQIERFGGSSRTSRDDSAERAREAAESAAREAQRVEAERTEKAAARRTAREAAAARKRAAADPFAAVLEALKDRQSAREVRYEALKSEPLPDAFDVHSSTLPEDVSRAQAQYLTIPEQTRRILTEAGVKVRMAPNTDVLPGNQYAGLKTSDGRSLGTTSDGRSLGTTSYFNPTDNNVYLAAADARASESGSTNVIAHELGHALDFNALELNPVTVTWQEPSQDEIVTRPTKVYQDVYLTWAHREYILNNPDVSDYFRTGSEGNARSGRQEWIAEGFAAMVEGDDGLLERLSGGSRGADIFRWTMRRLGLL
jgi:hypothetical protein